MCCFALEIQAGAGEHIPTYRLVGTKFWGKVLQKDNLKAKLGQKPSIVGTKFKSWHQVEKRSPAPDSSYNLPNTGPFNRDTTLS